MCSHGPDVTQQASTRNNATAAASAQRGAGWFADRSGADCVTMAWAALDVPTRASLPGRRHGLAGPDDPLGLPGPPISKAVPSFKISRLPTPGVADDANQRRSACPVRGARRPRDSGEPPALVRGTGHTVPR